MPIYEYQCQACGHSLEAFQKMSEAALVDCPACGKATLQKLVSAAGFQLKGTGWYATDFKNKSPEKSDKTETKSENKVTSSEPSKNKDSSSSSNTTDSSKADK